MKEIFAGVIYGVLATVLLLSGAYYKILILIIPGLLFQIILIAFAIVGLIKVEETKTIKTKE